MFPTMLKPGGTTAVTPGQIEEIEYFVIFIIGVQKRAS